MASELRVNTLKDAAGNNSIATSFVANGSAKAWVNYNQTAPSVRESFNVSSTSDVSTGIATISWSSNFSNATYSPVIMADADPASHYAFPSTRATLSGANAVFTTSAHQFCMHNIGGTVLDSFYITGQYLGDLA